MRHARHRQECDGNGLKMTIKRFKEIVAWQEEWKPAKAVYEPSRMSPVQLSTGKAKVRDSSVELLRIVMMLMIIAHHYVVNSGLLPEILLEGEGNITKPGLLFLMFGAWGKVGINCFVLITGYFMCTGHATIRKFLKLYFQILFYRVIIWLVFFISGYEVINLSRVFYLVWPL